MKTVILSAGQGTRLLPLTEDKPKAMVEYKGKPILQYIIDASLSCNIKDISAVVGYKKENIQKIIKQTFFNPIFDLTNMVYSLSFAKDYMLTNPSDMIVSYGDIIYKSVILESLLNSKDTDISLISDKNWENLWRIRMENIYSDVESFKTKDNKVFELGKKTNNKKDIEGQYIGLFKVHSHKVIEFFSIYEKLQNKLPEKEWKNMYMTSYIQHLIDIGWNVKPVWIEGGWLEIDSINDLNSYESLETPLV